MAYRASFNVDELNRRGILCIYQGTNLITEYVLNGKRPKVKISERPNTDILTPRDLGLILRKIRMWERALLDVDIVFPVDIEHNLREYEVVGNNLYRARWWLHNIKLLDFKYNRNSNKIIFLPRPAAYLSWSSFKDWIGTIALALEHTKQLGPAQDS